MVNVAAPYRVVKCMSICLVLFLAIGLPSVINAGNLTDLATLVGKPGDLGTDVTITSTLVQLCEDVVSVSDGIGSMTDASLTTDLVDTKVEIDALNESVCVLLKTILLQLAEIKTLVTP